MALPKPCIECGCVTSNSYCDECRNKRDRTRHHQKGRRPSQGWLETRTRVLTRDGYQCRVEGCNRTHHLHIHRLDGGYHDGNVDAYITLCPEHHRQVEKHSARPSGTRSESKPDASFLVF